MPESLRFHRLAPSDLRAAIQWYDGISKHLGSRFRDAVDACFDEIEIDPSRFSRIDEGLCYARVAKFPFLVLFQQLDQTACVLGVFHAASNPDKWRRRIDG